MVTHRAHGPLALRRVVALAIIDTTLIMTVMRHTDCDVARTCATLPIIGLEADLIDPPISTS